MAIEEGHGKDKSRLLVSIFPLGRDSARAGQLVIVRDLDPVQRLESVVDNSERLARLGGLFSGVAHQIRNPLNAITLELELLSQDARESKPVEDHVHAVREEMSRIDLVIEALMRFMRPGQLKIERVAANDLLSEVAKGVNEPLIEVRCDLDPAAAFVKADRAVLMEALRNIVQNAVDAMPKGGTLTFTSALVDGFVELSISDTGAGNRARASGQYLPALFHHQGGRQRCRLAPGAARGRPSWRHAEHRVQAERGHFGAHPAAARGPRLAAGCEHQRRLGAVHCTGLEKNG